jgi:hypothetical protein
MSLRFACRSRDDVILYTITLLEALRAVANYGAVMDKNILPDIVAEEALPFRVVEPLYLSLLLSHNNLLPFTKR